MNKLVGYVLLQKGLGGGPVEVYDESIYVELANAQSVAQDAWFEGEELLVCQVEEVSWDPPPCAAVTSAGSRHIDPEPPEYCEEPAVLGSEYCAIHFEEELL